MDNKLEIYLEALKWDSVIIYDKDPPKEKMYYSPKRSKRIKANKRKKK